MRLFKKRYVTLHILRKKKNLWKESFLVGVERLKVIEKVLD